MEILAHGAQHGMKPSQIFYETSAALLTLAQVLEMKQTDWNYKLNVLKKAYQPKALPEEISEEFWRMYE